MILLLIAVIGIMMFLVSRTVNENTEKLSDIQTALFTQDVIVGDDTLQVLDVSVNPFLLDAGMTLSNGTKVGIRYCTPEHTLLRDTATFERLYLKYHGKPWDGKDTLRIE